MHYLDDHKQWRTIDHRLRPVNGRNGIYAAMNQPLPVKFDLASHYTSIDLGTFELKHNQELLLYYVKNKEDAAISPQTGNYTNYIIGDDGTRIHNMWSGIDLEAFAKEGQIETNFIITKRPMLPFTNGYMVVEDHISVPQDIA
jgi:hypothetical protein